MEIKKILVVFKTHLDIGYTHLAAHVLDQYMNQMIPAAIKTARQLRETGGEERLIWTIGSWLIAEYLRTQSVEKVREMREAIEAGDVRWHGIPFTMHTDIMSAELFEYGLTLSQRLDACVVAPQEPSILHFTNAKPQDEDPIHFNLFNNVWGTNFPQWFEEDARFRFVLHVK